ncbi:hypothetical protein GHT09_013986 [Marmota monax]|uniref:Uncharacterized protein n=1 Tax=Marmota monax TaxID=9995 RepID=A0A834PL46_MARMO|nr:hypothetical protein GHT09_013986 [Marmota monax]
MEGWTAPRGHCPTTEWHGCERQEHHFQGLVVKAAGGEAGGCQPPSWQEAHRSAGSQRDASRKSAPPGGPALASFCGRVSRQPGAAPSGPGRVSSPEPMAVRPHSCCDLGQHLRSIEEDAEAQGTLCSQAWSFLGDLETGHTEAPAHPPTPLPAELS